MKNTGPINDINEALQKGVSLDDIAAAAMPVMEDLDPEILHRRYAYEGVANLNSLFENIKTQGDIDTVREIIVNTDMMTNIAWAWMLRKNEIQQLIFKITSLHKELKKPMRSLLNSIKKQCIQIETNNREKFLTKKNTQKPLKYKPDSQTLNMLDRKPIKEKGEIVDYGAPYPTMYNAEMVFRHDPRWVGRIRYSNFDHSTHIDGKSVIDTAEARCGSWLTRVYGFEIADKKLASRLHLIGMDNAYHPVQDYFLNLKWDGTPRLKNLFVDYIPADNIDSTNFNEFSLGKNENEYYDYTDVGFTREEIPTIQQIYGIRYMIACVARAMDPGCKQDSAICLIGKQSANKSQTVEALAVHRKWWSATPFDLTKKDAYMHVLGKWIVEIPEGETLHRSGYNAAKSFMSLPHARFRRPFDRNAGDHDLSHCFWITTNDDSLPFLNDSTGSRRYWVLRVKTANLAKIRADLHQLWAEAIQYYWNGEQWWLEQHEEDKRDLVNEIYRTRDSWEDTIAGWISHCLVQAMNKKVPRKFEFAVSDVLTGALKIPSRMQSNNDVTRIANILKRLGCIKEGRRKYGRTYRHMWIIPDHLEDDFLAFNI